MTNPALNNLGFDDWFAKHVDPENSDTFEIARVTEVHKESYVLTNGLWTARGEVTGKLMFSADSPLDFPAVGDWCKVQFFDENSPAIIHEVLPRKSLLKRKTAGKKVDFQPIAANLDTAFIVGSLDEDFSVNRFERYLVMIREGKIEPFILLSKKDLVSDEELREKISAVKAAIPNVSLLAFSSSNGDGLDKISNLIARGQTFCLLGSSGVGKTTLLNRLIGAEIFETKEVREKDSKGRHTTTGRQLIVLESGAMIIDTPGMRELGNFGVDSGINDVFDEITALASQCKFNDCTHSKEAGCAVLGAIEKGEISRDRFENYEKMKRENERNEMSFFNMRKKAKKLGKLYKSVQKHNVKNR